MSELRKKIAKLATYLYSGDISYEKFMDEIPEMDEDELVDLIEHEPKAGGLFGVTKKEHEKYMEQRFSIIEKLKE